MCTRLEVTVVEAIEIVQVVTVKYQGDLGSMLPPSFYEQLLDN